MSDQPTTLTALPVAPSVPQMAPRAAHMAPAAAPSLAPRPARHAMLAANAQSALTHGVQQLGYQVMRAGPMGSTGLAALALALVMAVAVWLPAHHAELALRGDLLQATGALHAGPVTGGPGHLLAGLPSRGEVPAVLAQILAQADQAGVALDQGHYNYRPPQNGVSARYSLEFPVKGDYPRVRDFIDRTLSTVPAAAVEKLRIERKNVGDPVIHADVGFVLYLRGE
jgi:hypothetical protein